MNKWRLVAGSLPYRLIDSYSDGIIDKNEFEPRIKQLKKDLSYVEQKISQLIDNQTKQSELKQMVGKLEEFSDSIKEKLNDLDLDWSTKRAIIIALIKQVEISRDTVNIIFRVEPYPKAKNVDHLLEDCRKSADPRVSDFHINVPINEPNYGLE